MRKYLCWKNPTPKNDFPSQLWRILIVAYYIYDQLVFGICAQHGIPPKNHEGSDFETVSFLR